MDSGQRRTLDSMRRRGADAHGFVLSERTPEMAEWRCPVCGRTLRLDRATRRFRVIAAGDAHVNHGAASLDDALTMRGRVEGNSRSGTVH